MKTCSKCGVEKDIACFSFDKRANDGRKSECKECHNSYRKKSRRDDWVKDLSDEYVKSKLVRSGFSTKQINDNPELIELRRHLIKLRRTIWQNSKM